MSVSTIALTLLAIAARRVVAFPSDEEGEVASGSSGAQAVMNATQPTGSGSSTAPLHTTPFNNAIPYCSFSGGLRCDPLTTHQKLFVILSATILGLVLLFLLTLCCCCCCSRRRTARRTPPSIYVSSSSSSLEAPASAQGPYYGAYGGQAPYGQSRLNDQRPPAGSGGTGGREGEKRQAVYGRDGSRM